MQEGAKQTARLSRYLLFEVSICKKKTSLSYILKRRRDVGKCFEESLRGGELGKNLGKF